MDCLKTYVTTQATPQQCVGLLMNICQHKLSPTQWQQSGITIGLLNATNVRTFGVVFYQQKMLQPKYRQQTLNLDKSLQSHRVIFHKNTHHQKNSRPFNS